MKVLSFGEILLRLASPGYTKLFQKDSLDATFCGGEANVAVSLANFGVQSEFLTVLPDNDVGHEQDLFQEWSNGTLLSRKGSFAAPF